MKTTIYLTRHGETIWNLEKRLQGWNNSPLTKDGIDQAKNLSKRLEDINIDVIYTSPSERAFKTAKILKGEKDLEIKLHEGLKEMGFGLWEGMIWEEIENSEKYGKELYNLYYNPKEYKPFEGEKLDVFEKRTKEALEEIIENNKGKDVLIVTHGITLKLMVGYFENLGIEETIKGIVMGQTSLTKITIEEDTYNIEFKNDTSHYQDDYIKKGW